MGDARDERVKLKKAWSILKGLGKFSRDLRQSSVLGNLQMLMRCLGVNEQCSGVRRALGDAREERERFSRGLRRSSNVLGDAREVLRDSNRYWAILKCHRRCEEVTSQ